MPEKEETCFHDLFSGLTSLETGLSFCYNIIVFSEETDIGWEYKEFIDILYRGKKNGKSEQ